MNLSLNVSSNYVYHGRDSNFIYDKKYMKMTSVRDKSQVYIIMFHVDRIYVECKELKIATITDYNNLK